MINSNLSVVTVTLNNSSNLRKTLSSIAECVTKPACIIIVDGGSSDDTEMVVKSYSRKLNIDFRSQQDRGIYDAMNKGKRQITTPLVHYLNAGDSLLGDPYASVLAPCLLPVSIIDDLSGRAWDDFVKLEGFGYCHQGIIFPAGHEDYDTRYDLSADFKLICRTFPKGLSLLPCNHGGRVIYPLGGVSSIRSFEGKFQTLEIARENLSLTIFLRFAFAQLLQSMLPRTVRRFILSRIRA